MATIITPDRTRAWRQAEEQAFQLLEELVHEVHGGTALDSNVVDFFKSLHQLVANLNEQAKGHIGFL